MVYLTAQNRGPAQEPDMERVLGQFPSWTRQKRSNGSNLLQLRSRLRIRLRRTVEHPMQWITRIIETQGVGLDLPTGTRPGPIVR